MLPFESICQLKLGLPVIGHQNFNCPPAIWVRLNLPHCAREALLLSVPGNTRLLLEAAIMEIEFIWFTADLVACNTRTWLLESL